MHQTEKLKACLEDLALIAGQKPVITKFKKLYLILKLEKVLTLELKLHCVHIKCMNLLIDL